MPWATKDESDAKWIVKSFPAVPFVRYEDRQGKPYDLYDNGRVMGLAHDYKIISPNPTVSAGYFLKRESFELSSRTRNYRLTVSDMHTGSELVVINTFYFTWWTLGGNAYGVSYKVNCYDSKAIEKIRAAFKP